MAQTETFPWSPLDALQTQNDMIMYLNAALEENEPELIAIVLADIAQAVGKSQMASDAGFSRKRLEQLAHEEPGFSDMLHVIKSLGLQLYATAAPGSHAA